MWYIILKKRFQAFYLHILFCHFYFTNMCKWRLKYDDCNEIWTNFWTVKSLVKYPCINTNIYISVKSNYSAFLKCNLFCYSCGITVRIQQNITWVHNCSRGKCEKAFHWMLGFATKLWLATEKSKTSPATCIRQQVHIKVTILGGLDLN